MQDSPKVQRWKEWFGPVKSDATTLVVNHHVYVEVKRIIAHSPVARQSSAFHAWLGDVYVGATVVRVRRFVSRSKGEPSLWKLLEDMKKHNVEISRSRHKALWMQHYGGPDWEEIWLPLADDDFDRLCGEGCAHLSKESVGADMDSLRKETEAIKRYANERVAHYAPSPLKSPPTYGDLEAAIAQVEKLVLRYELMLFGSAPDTLLPVWQYNWKAIFAGAWVKSSQDT
jgi:hypothetical protein